MVELIRIMQEAGVSDDGALDLLTVRYGSAISVSEIASQLVRL